MNGITVNCAFRDGKFLRRWYVSKTQKDENTLYLWRDKIWRLTAWNSYEDHAYFDTKEEAEALVKSIQDEVLEVLEGDAD